MTITTTNSSGLRQRAEKLRLWGVVAYWEELYTEPWLEKLITREETIRAQRSLEQRINTAKLGQFKQLSDFDWKWPKEIDQMLIEEILSLDFVCEPANLIIIGQNGVGKTMLAKNFAHQAVLAGHSALFITASELLNNLAAADSSSALEKRLKYYCRPQVLVVDELGYLATSSEHAELLFELVARRYQQKPIILTSNKPFTQWSEVFPNASCVVALVDRLIHKAEIIKIEADSYRRKEAQERDNNRKIKRNNAKKKD